MNSNNNGTMQMHDENISEGKLELQYLGSKMGGKTSVMVKKETMLQRHMEDMAARNKTWVDRLFLPAEERAMLKGYVEKQTEAVNIVLDNQNMALADMCSGQAAFVKEVVNTLLKTGRAGLKAGADLIFMEYRNQRFHKIESAGNEFYNQIERKMADAETRPERLKEMKFAEVDRDLKKWAEDYALLQDEFSDILKQQV